MQKHIDNAGRDFCNLAVTSFRCKLGPDRPGRLPGTPASNQNPALRPRPNILRKCRGPQRPQNSPNPVATPKGCQGNTQNQTRIYLRHPAKSSKKVPEILNKSMSQGTKIGILQSLGLLVHPSSIQVTKEYQRTCHETAKGCRGKPQKSRDSDQKPLKSVLRTNIVRRRQTGAKK